jgi:hypothetical protein
MLTGSSLRSQFKRAFISAPFGLRLGALPHLLAESGIEWQWAKELPESASNPSNAIKEADFFIGIMNRSSADYRVVYEAGVAAGIGKPILLIMTPAKTLPIDLRQFTIARVKLDDEEALALHLNAFLSAPRRDIFRSDPTPLRSGALEPPGLKASEVTWGNTLESQLEEEVFRVVEENGGSVIAQPQFEVGARYRPDMLVWLGAQEPELLDPAVVEVKRRVQRSEMRKVEEQLLSFMSVTGVRTGLIITSDQIPERSQQSWPNLFWLEFHHFEELVRTSRLGPYLRDVRNRFVHGAL